MTAPVPAAPGLPTIVSEPGRRLVLTGFASFLLIGWASLLVPSLVRQVEADFGQRDAGIGALYLVYSLLYVAGSLASGFVTDRAGRRLVLPAGAVAMAAGLGVAAGAPAWPLFVVGYVTLGLGAGVIDAGVNALFMDLFADRRSGALNRLHLFFSIGALLAPLVIGQLVNAGVAWRLLLVATAIGAAVIAAVLLASDLPHGRHVRAARPAGSRPATRVPLRQRLPFPLIALAIAIGCYVPSEMGVSSWLVRYLDEATLETATLALSLFWAGLTLGRFVSSFVADRMGAVRFATTCAFAAGVLILAAVVTPWLPARIALFAAAGFASGPIYPMIMSIAGSFYPNRASLVSGLLSAAAVLGSTIYPPLMGFISESAGLGIGMLGAGIFSIACGGAVLVAGSAGRRMPLAAAA